MGIGFESLLACLLLISFALGTNSSWERELKEVKRSTRLSTVFSFRLPLSFILSSILPSLSYFSLVPVHFLLISLVLLPDLIPCVVCLLWNGLWKGSCNPRPLFKGEMRSKLMMTFIPIILVVLRDSWGEWEALCSIKRWKPERIILGLQPQPSQNVCISILSFQRWSHQPN